MVLYLQTKTTTTPTTTTTNMFKAVLLTVGIAAICCTFNVLFMSKYGGIYCSIDVAKASSSDDQPTTMIRKTNTNSNDNYSNNNNKNEISTFEVQQCDKLTLTVIDKENSETTRGWKSRCPDTTWLEEYFMYKQYQRLFEKKQPQGETPFLGISIGCNKGFDAVNSLRMGSYNPAVTKQVWKKQFGDIRGACGQSNVPEFKPILDNLEPIPNSEFHCVEPMISNIEALNKAMKESGYDKHGLHVHQYAVSNKDGHVFFPSASTGTEHLGLSNCDSSGTTTGKERAQQGCDKVNMTTVDTLLETAVSDANKDTPIEMLSIDTEGHDMEVLLGSTNALKRAKYVEFEYHKTGVWPDYTLKPAIDLMDQNDFTCYWMLKGKFQLVRISKCWLDQYNKGMWSNVACVNNKLNPGLGVRMEAVHDEYVKEAMKNHNK